MKYQPEKYPRAAAAGRALGLAIRFLFTLALIGDCLVAAWRKHYDEATFCMLTVFVVAYLNGDNR